MDKNIHIGIVGAGKIGTAIYNLLLSSSYGYRVSVADILPEFGDVQVGQKDYVQLDENKEVVEGESTQFNSFVKKLSIFLNCETNNDFIEQNCDRFGKDGMGKEEFAEFLTWISLAKATDW